MSQFDRIDHLLGRITPLSGPMDFDEWVSQLAGSLLPVIEHWSYWADCRLDSDPLDDEDTRDARQMSRSARDALELVLSYVPCVEPVGTVPSIRADACRIRRMAGIPLDGGGPVMPDVLVGQRAGSLLAKIVAEHSLPLITARKLAGALAAVVLSVEHMIKD